MLVFTKINHNGRRDRQIVIPTSDELPLYVLLGGHVALHLVLVYWAVASFL